MMGGHRALPITLEYLLHSRLKTHVLHQGVERVEERICVPLLLVILLSREVVDNKVSEEEAESFDP